MAVPEPVVVAPVDSDGDGVPDERDANATEPQDVDGFEDDDGAPEPDNDHDNILDAVDRCPLETGVSPHGCPGVDMAQITFARGSDRLSREGARTLSGIVETLAQHPEIDVVQVEGHSDESGEPDANTQLSLRRAAQVRRQLLRRGVAAERLEAVGCGEHYPIGNNHDANRRVQFWSHARGDGTREGCVR